MALRSHKPRPSPGGDDDKPKSVKINLAFPILSYGRSFYFNRFRVEMVDSYVLMTFGMVRSSGEVLCNLRCFISVAEANENKDSVMQFLGANLEDVPLVPQLHYEPPPPTNPNTTDIPIVNRINISLRNRDKIAEIVLTRFSVTAAAQILNMETSQKPQIPTEGIAFLRCEIPVFKLFLAKLYEAIDSPAP